MKPGVFPEKPNVILPSKDIIVISAIRTLIISNISTSAVRNRSLAILKAQTMINPNKVYQSLSPNQKMNYWTTLSNMLLVLITFWLGFTIQYIVADKNASIAAKNQRAEYAEKMMPVYEDLIGMEVYWDVQKTLKRVLNKTNSWEKEEKILSGAYSSKQIEVITPLVESETKILALADSLYRPALRFLLGFSETEQFVSFRTSAQRMFYYKYLYEVLFIEKHPTSESAWSSYTKKIDNSVELRTLAFQLDNALESTTWFVELKEKFTSFYKDLYIKKVNKETMDRFKATTLVYLMYQEIKVAEAMFNEMQTPKKDLFINMQTVKFSVIWLFIAIVLGYFIVLLYINIVSPRVIAKHYTKNEYDTILQERNQFKANWNAISASYDQLEEENEELAKRISELETLIKGINK